MEESKEIVVYKKKTNEQGFCTSLLTPTIKRTCRFDDDVVELDSSSDGNLSTIYEDKKESGPKKMVSFFKKRIMEGSSLRGSGMSRMTESFSKFKNERGKGLRNSINRYRNSIKKITSKVVKADKTWVGCMIGMSTIDILLNLANFVQMSDSDLEYGLVIGPPSRVLWYTLLTFTCMSWLLFVPETLNSLSVLYSPARETYFPIAIEMTVTLIFKHIPLSTVVYFVGRCRREYTTSLESICNGFRLVHILGRLVWYAHLEGRKLKKNDKHTLQKSFVLLSLLLFGVATSFVIKNWRNEPDTRLKRYHLVNVSILMLSEPHANDAMGQRFPPEVKSFKLNASTLIRRHGYDAHRPFLVKSLLIVKEKGYYTSDYYCDSNNGYQDLKPFECDEKTEILRFHFVYYEPTITAPYGEIKYNFVKLQKRASYIYPVHDENDDDESSLKFDKKKYVCVETDEELQNYFKLYYLEVTKFYDNLENEQGISIIVSSPFRKTWTHPRPRYEEDLKICRKEQVLFAPKEYPTVNPLNPHQMRNEKKVTGCL